MIFLTYPSKMATWYPDEMQLCCRYLLPGVKIEKNTKKCYYFKRLDNLTSLPSRSEISLFCALVHIESNILKNGSNEHLCDTCLL